MSTTKYAAVAVAFLSAAFFIGAIGFMVASETFISSATDQPEIQMMSDARSEQTKLASPASLLIGSHPKVMAHVSTNANGEWVKVIDAVKMRTGASSGDSLIKVQLEGARLRVVSRDGNWINVVEPQTELQGWVYKKYVTTVEPEVQRARVADAQVE